MNKIYRSALLVVGLSLGVSVAHADYHKGTTSFQIYGGGAGFGGRYDLPARDDERPYADGGGVIGGQFLYFIKDMPSLAVGFDVLHAGFDRHNSTLLLPNRYTQSSADNTAGFFVGRLSYPKGRFRPYVQGGVGVHHTALQLQASPINGFSWPDTGTSEDRNLYKEGHTGPALEGAIGIYFYFVENFFIGAEYKEIGLFGPDFSPTMAGRSEGLGDTKGSVGESMIGFMAGFGF